MAAKKTSKPMAKHVDRTTTPYTGPAKVDATPLASLLVDLPKGARKGLRTALPGIDGVVAELGAAMPADGAEAGIPPSLYTAFANGCTNIANLTQLWQTTAKLAEVMEETLALLQDTREQQLSQMGDAIRSTAKRTKSDAVKAPFQKTLAYLGQYAVKGVKTRQEKKAQTAAAATPATTAPAAAAR
jgi:hypothetical protein